MVKISHIENQAYISNLKGNLANVGSNLFAILISFRKHFIAANVHHEPYCNPLKVFYRFFKPSIDFLRFFVDVTGIFLLKTLVCLLF